MALDHRTTAYRNLVSVIWTRRCGSDLRCGIVGNVTNISLSPDYRTQGLDIGVPESVQIIGHCCGLALAQSLLSLLTETKHVHTTLHGFGVKCTEVPIIGCQSQ